MEYFVSIYAIKSSRGFNLLSEFHFWENERTRKMTDLEDTVNLDEIVFDDNSQLRISWSCLGQTYFRYLIVFLSQFSTFCLISFGCFGELFFQKLVTYHIFRWDICVLQLGSFYHHQDCAQSNFYKKSRLHSAGQSIGDGRATTNF